MESLPQIGPLHTDVVIVGNGPSALALSFMLAGHRPYYDGTPLSNEFLNDRLVKDMEVSLVDKELEPLCEGLEGRSNNPVALLFDNLFHPDADLGLDNPSVIDWKHEEQTEIDHVVLGKTKAGGTWQKIDGTMQTISQNTWMELPNVPFREWMAQNRRNSGVGEPMYGRATIGDVKDYYLDYVKSQGLQRYFKDNYTVTSVQRVYHLRNAVDSESGEVEPCCRNVRRNHTHCWEVRGYHSVFDDQGQAISRQDFCYLAPHVVLAAGAYDIPNRLGVEGENRPFVTHSLGDFEKHLSSSALNTLSDPVLVVGAGLSAADAILMAMESNVPVIHVFRRGPSDPSLIFSKLPSTMYPEYHRIHSLMKGKETSELYRPMARHNVIEILDHKVLVGTKKQDQMATFDISFAAIMIGSRADLGFLPREGRHLGVVPKWPIDSKHNPIDVDVYSYQSAHEPQMFAMGPLVGDSFVRFGIGGALGIVNHLRKCHKKENL
ncbi:oxidative stress-induced growth inhibitor 2 [Aplysia californica]|uniref:Oxidative stress-induced growth inhibitor 2 n=1 Tax=Aplysia californica TaxID=6500 RepID=A0ABM0K6D1_APLCA|nr:oxidative stress-induced growth inhibitor 2 [Aplysia californica]XP_005109786.1 oxidative stress-induced growth inhibitor 2 [Aplysia californica]